MPENTTAPGKTIEQIAAEMAAASDLRRDPVMAQQYLDEMKTKSEHPLMEPLAAVMHVAIDQKEWEVDAVLSFIMTVIAAEKGREPLERLTKDVMKISLMNSPMTMLAMAMKRMLEDGPALKATTSAGTTAAPIIAVADNGSIN